jgi:glycosyltransferase involved in cell wall biosynthesis
MSKQVLVAVINDIATDQRVDKICRFLAKHNSHATVICRKLKTSPPINETPYKYIRLNMFFNKKALMYAEFNIRLFLILLFKKADFLIANDLDTLLGAFLAAKLKRKPIIYDSHEYFTEVPEIQNRKWVKKTWLMIEEFLFPKLKTIYTVNQSIANIYKNKYHKKIGIIRNLSPVWKNNHYKTRNELGLPENKHILIIQGTGINIDRGAEEIIEAMQYINNAILLIIGSGQVIPVLKKMNEDLKLQDKIIFINQIPYEELKHYTKNADLGLSLDKDTNLNYRYSLPNKLFSYIQAQTPILASDLPEISAIINKYKIGEIIATHNPKTIATTINNIFNDESKIKIWKENLKIAAIDLSWEKEEEKLLAIYKPFLV